MDLTSLLVQTDLSIAKELVYDKCGFELTHLLAEPESTEYGAFTFRLNGKKVKHRASKITPTKTGQFVTIWKRTQNGITAPFEVSDDIDLLIITARGEHHLGQFIFPKSTLLDKGIISGPTQAGKRGMRVYPPWDKVTNKQAEKTQKWQTAYFLEISDQKPVNVAQAKKLLAPTIEN